MTGPRVVLVDDHALFRSGVIAELDDGVEVVGEAGDVQEAVELIEIEYEAEPSASLDKIK